MKFAKRLFAALAGASVLFGVGVFAQEETAPRPMQEQMHQGMGPGGGMEHHQEIADGIAKVRENLVQLQDETDAAKIRAALAENVVLLEKVEGMMAARRTMMQLRMAQPRGPQ